MEAEVAEDIASPETTKDVRIDSDVKSAAVQAKEGAASGCSSAKVENIDKVKRAAEIKNAAIMLLSRREHSKHELKTKLSRKFSDPVEIETQLEKLAEKDYQSDERFVESFIRSKKSHGKGPNFIKQELRRRGISEYLTAAYVYEDDDDWMSLAETVYEKKFGDTAVVDVKEKSRRIRFMVSRGFSPDMVFRLLDK